MSEWHCRVEGGSTGGEGMGKVNKASRAQRADGAARAVPSGEWMETKSWGTMRRVQRERCASYWAICTQLRAVFPSFLLQDAEKWAEPEQLNTF